MIDMILHHAKIPLGISSEVPFKIKLLLTVMDLNPFGS